MGEDNRMAVKAGLTLNSGNSLDPYLNAVRADPNFTEAIALALDLALKMAETPSNRDYVIPSLEELERLQPDFWKIPFSLGHFLDRMNRETEAIEAFWRAVNLKPDFSEGYYRVGKIYELQSKEREAETQYRQALQYDENHARALTSLGTILGNRGQHDEAIQLWLRAVEIDPKSAVALQNLGKAYETKGDETTARQYYARANQENPEGNAGRQTKESLVHLTNLPAASKEPTLVLDIPVVTGPFGAAEVRRDEAQKDEKQGEFWGQFKEAGDLIKQNRWEEALPILQKLASVKQDAPQLQYGLGLALFKAGRVEEAVTALRTALKLQRDPHVAKQLGVILIRAGRGSEAREALQIAAAIDPKDAEVDYYRAELALKERRFSEAEEVIRQAIGKKPSDPDNYVLSAAIQGKRGHWPQALSDLEAARRLGYQSADNLREMERIVQGKWRSERIGRFWLAAVTGYVALLAFLFLAGCVLSLLQGRWVARASERILTANDRTPAERRLSRWYTFTILSAVGLFYLSLPFMVVGMLWGAGYLIYAMLNEPGGELGRPALYFLIAAIGGTWAILRGLFARPMANPLEQPLSEQDQSKLFELLREVAQATGTPMVDEVHVAPDSGIGVHMEGRAIAALFGRAKRVLTIGVATLHALTTPELKAILAHEYGHFSNRDTDYNGVLFQVELSLAHTLQGMASLGRYGWLNPVFWLLKLYRVIYVLITRGFRRTMELFADRVAAVTYGSKDFSSALEKVSVYGAFFERHAYQEVATLLKEQKAFQNVYQAFEEGWNKLEPAVQDQMKQAALSRRPHWTDSHPPPKDRIARLQHLPFNSADGGEPSSTVFHDFPALQESMSNRLTQYVATVTRAR
jgi:tetratricopeptide (TPR) repeat protein